MFGAFAQVFHTPDLRRKLLFILFIMAASRPGSFILIPGADSQAAQRCMVQEPKTPLLDLVNLLSSGAPLQLSIFTLGIMPYAAASTIIQLLRVVIPRFDDLHREGQTGQAKLTQYTRYLTIFLGILQVTTTISLARSDQLFQLCNRDIIRDRSVMTFIVMIIVMMASTGMIMQLGELTTECGIGNGMSLLVLTSIVARLPERFLSIGQTSKWDSVVTTVALLLLVTIAVVYVEQVQYHVPVQYAKRTVERRQYGSTTTYIPLKINMSGVIFVIFTSSIFALPPMVAQSGSPDGKWVQWISAHFTQGNPFYLTVYALMTPFLTFFYTVITFDPNEVTDSMKKYGGSIPGYRVGRLTAECLRCMINRITTAGALYLVIITLPPSFAIIPLQLSNSQTPFGDTTLLVIIGVGLQTAKEINTQLRQHHHEGLLK